MTTKNRILSVLMALTMLFSLLPSRALAEGEESACDHDWVAGETVPATCTEGGYTLYTCSLCNDEKEDDLTDPLGHDWVAGDTVSATCTEGGYTLYTCSLCNDEKEDDLTDPLGHDWVAGEAVPATCTKGGYTLYTCSRCEEEKEDDLTDPLGHTPKEVDEVPATKTKPGHKAGTVCAVCEEVLSGCEIIYPPGSAEITKDAVAEEKPEITVSAQPADAEIRNGEAEFSVSASVSPEGTALSLQWQRLDASQEYKDREAAWTDIADEADSKLRLTGLTDPAAAQEAANCVYRCRITAGETSVLTDEVSLKADLREFKEDVVTGFAGPEPETITQKDKPALIVLESFFPKEITFCLGGTVLYEKDEDGRDVISAVSDAAEKSYPVTWKCTEDYDKDLAFFDFVPELDDWNLAPGLTLPTLQVQVGELLEGETGGHIPSEIGEVPLVGSAMKMRGSGEYIPFTFEGGKITDSQLPPVRDQGAEGACWAFGNIGSVEADLIKETGNPSIDLSELYLTYYSAHKYTGLRNQTEDNITYSGNNYLSNGGNNEIAYRTLANGIGPVNESDAPYPYGSPGGTPKYQVTGAYLINPNDNAAIKSAIRNHGGVDAAFFASGYYYSSTYNSYYCDVAGTNHEVMLVGWKDDFPAEHFSEGTPPGDGAWLVRNSWGLNNYGYNGYFWISYYDESLLSDVITAYDAESRDFDYCYAHDSIPYPAGRVDLDANQGISQSFTIVDHETIKAVGFETYSTDLAATVTVTVGDRSSSGNCYTSFAGFYYVPLNSPLAAAKGDTATVTLSFGSPATVAVEGKPNIDSTFANKIKYTASCDGGGYTIGETRTERDARIKLYTVEGSSAGTPTAVSGLTLSGSSALRENEAGSATDYSLSVECGASEKLTATVTPADASNRMVSWTSDNRDIASVENGVVTGVSPGTATITARAGELSVTCTVTVGGTSVESIGINYKTTHNTDFFTFDDASFEGASSGFDVTSETKISFSYTILPEKPSNKTVFWESSKPDVMTVNSASGLGRIQGNGETILTVKTQDGGKSDSLNIIVSFSTYTVSYNANGGTGGPQGTENKTRYIPIWLSTVEPVRDAYVFRGWSTNADGTGTIYPAGSRFNENGSNNGSTITLYAVWQPVITIATSEVPTRTVSADGVTCEVNDDGTVVIPAGTSVKVIESFQYTGSSDDVHTQYPTDLKVWVVRESGGTKTAERIPALDNIMRYSGFSIRITGKKGIRMITSVPTELKNALTSSGLAGYTLEEYGTIVGWADELNGRDLTWENKRFSNYAYKRNTADPVFKTVNGMSQYTNVLVGFTDEQVPRDLVMRSYMILSGSGDQIIIYGGAVQRSIGYVAYQNRNAFQPGTASYNYVWNLIRITYGNRYDSEYRR
ncbi:MAG: Ig-like domain-containing protein [Oscillospiraceae bacterium]|nr:Ig-like domain-containing protein [Oscillospiraceae bacterium]